ncbi:ATP-binding SpoIIE family protein phosphatase [Variovorax sp. dw_308]|uniref:ATP-binding SpoIIE family protein phosphatase n=1 Tax=Variovorax sp. dw_308 TaxID=2721546 RepID=UPI001C45280F|nr:ATP-binding SpoIIE family protein phosphatase [Variovorax sp. dw_308]
MEMKAMGPHLAMPVIEPTQVGEARRAAARLTHEMGFDELASGRAALVVTELGTNLAKHARDGMLLLGCIPGAAGGTLEVLSLDQGPGIADLRQSLVDGHSTQGSPGTGLGAVRRLASEAHLFSVPGNGTVIVARIHAKPAPGVLAHGQAFSVGGIRLSAPGETVCGDSWDVRMNGSKARVMVADGLGHGPLAAEASQAAIQVFATAVGAPHAVLERAHALMRSTRGAAVAVVELDAAAHSLVFAGAGNIAGRLLSGVDDRTLMSQHGTLGVQIRKLADTSYPWPEHAMVVLHSDGINSRWNIDGALGILQQDPTLIAGWLLRSGLRGRDDATVVVIKRAQARGPAP